MSMNPDVKEKWVAALRSGEYKQGRSKLRQRDGTFCCLGVLCDVIDPNGWRRNGDGSWDYRTGDNRLDSAVLPRAIMEVAGIISSTGPDVTIDGHRTRLAMHNDVGGATFAQIADAIEAQL